MPTALSTVGREAVFGQESDKIAVCLLQLYSPELNNGTSLCLAAWRNPIVSRGIVFNPYPFQITLPEDSDERPPKAQIELDNISLEAAAWLRSINVPVRVKMEVIFVQTPDVVEYSSPTMDGVNAIFNTSDGKIIIPLSVYPYGRMLFPHRAFTPNLFPGLF